MTFQHFDPMPPHHSPHGPPLTDARPPFAHGAHGVRFDDDRDGPHASRGVPAARDNDDFGPRRGSGLRGNDDLDYSRSGNTNNDQYRSSETGKSAKQSISIDYAGYVVEKVAGSDGRKSSWSRAKTVALPADRETLAEACRKSAAAGKATAFTNLTSSSQREAIVSIVDKHQLTEHNRNAKWVLANIQLYERPSSFLQGKSKDSCYKMRVILKRVAKPSADNDHANTRASGRDFMDLHSQTNRKSTVDDDRPRRSLRDAFDSDSDGRGFPRHQERFSPNDDFDRRQQERFDDFGPRGGMHMPHGNTAANTAIRPQQPPPGAFFDGAMGPPPPMGAPFPPDLGPPFNGPPPMQQPFNGPPPPGAFPDPPAFHGPAPSDPFKNLPPVSGHSPLGAFPSQPPFNGPPPSGPFPNQQSSNFPPPPGAFPGQFPPSNPFEPSFEASMGHSPAPGFPPQHDRDPQFHPPIGPSPAFQPPLHTDPMHDREPLFNTSRGPTPMHTADRHAPRRSMSQQEIEGIAEAIARAHISHRSSPDSYTSDERRRRGAAAEYDSGAWSPHSHSTRFDTPDTTPPTSPHSYPDSYHWPKSSRRSPGGGNGSGSDRGGRSLRRPSRRRSNSSSNSRPKVVREVFYDSGSDRGYGGRQIFRRASSSAPRRYSIGAADIDDFDDDDEFNSFPPHDPRFPAAPPRRPGLDRRASIAVPPMPSLRRSVHYADDYPPGGRRPRNVDDGGRLFDHWPADTEPRSYRPARRESMHARSNGLW